MAEPPENGIMAVELAAVGGSYPANKRLSCEDGLHQAEELCLMDDGYSQSEPSIPRSNLYLECVGEVAVVLTDKGLSWHCTGNKDVPDNSFSSCWGLFPTTEMPSELLLCNIYAVELIGRGPVNDSKATAATDCLLGLSSKLHRFAVHFFEKSNKQHSVWIPKSLVFGHPDPKTCQAWYRDINNSLKQYVNRPKKLLVFVNPLSGKGHAAKTWETVAPLFVRADVSTKLVKTERAGHAFDIMKEITNEELNSYDGVIVVGGDGFFNEVLNGLLSWRHRAPYPPTPADIQHCFQDDASQSIFPSHDGLNHGELGAQTVQVAKKHVELDSAQSCYDKDSHPLLENPATSRVETSDLSSHQTFQSGYDLISKEKSEDDRYEVNQVIESSKRMLGMEYKECDMDLACVPTAVTSQGSCMKEGEATAMSSLANPWIRIGIIPAGSTDTIVISTTGVRDPITSALHIILGKKISLDIAQVVSWKRSAKSSEETPHVRYAASFVGYGFYGDVIKESESHRWMGPARYDFAGTRVFMRHRSYEAEVAFMEVPDEITSHTFRSEPIGGRKKADRNSKKTKCCMNCTVCAKGVNSIKSMVHTNREEMLCKTKSQVLRWTKSKGLFLSVGAAVISCRNDKAPDGLVAQAHLADGFLHLILIRDCTRAAYLWHLLQLTTKGADPLNFKFVEHHKTPVFTFVSHGEESVWNVDGELFPAHQLSAQVFRGLISLFATGPEI